MSPKPSWKTFSALDVDSADRPSDTNLIKSGGKCESQTEAHHNFPAPSFHPSTVQGLMEYIEYNSPGGKAKGTTIADVIK